MCALWAPGPHLHSGHSVSAQLSGSWGAVGNPECVALTFSGLCLELALVACRLLRRFREHLPFESVTAAQTLGNGSPNLTSPLLRGALGESCHFTFRKEHEPQ